MDRERGFQRLSKRRGLLILAVAAGAVALPAQEGTPAAKDPVRSSYVLGPEDQISIWASEAEDLSKLVTIGPEGSINLPMVGRIQAAGLKVEQLEAEITERLRTYIKEPQVAVSIAEFRSQPVRVEFLLGPQSPVREGLERLTPYLKRKSLTWAGLRPFVDLRQELLELDFKFGRLGSQGLFASLDRAGVLSHHVPGVDDIEHATTHPPDEGRARLRGQVIRRLAGKAMARCDWHRIWDGRDKRWLDLADPFATEERWEEFTFADRGGLLATLERMP